MTITRHPRRLWALGLVGYLVLVACISTGAEAVQRHRWWAGLGAVVPHDTFPDDCSACHEGSDWSELRDDFEFDHAAETGVALHGAHEQALCLRCHNDRGPVATFAQRGCAGCHEDIHLGQLGTSCDQCHNERTWRPNDMFVLHQRTRFPLEGAHAATSCRNCHEGAEVGRFVPVTTDCLGCHTDDLANALNPNHIGLGWVNRCDRCHQPTIWNQAEIDPDF
ncbi:MAG: cytochrome c3 family protein [Myxococcota bacterium]